MGDKATLTKAIKELEEMYSGVPDESVNLTFEDLANVIQNPNSPQKKKVPITNNNMDMESPNSLDNTTLVHEGNVSRLRKIPSLDFSKGLQASNQYHQQQHNHNNHHPLERINEEDIVHRFTTGHQYGRHDQHAGDQHGMNPINSVAHSGFRHAVESSMVNGDDQSIASVYQEKIVGRRRPGIPHSKICTVCSTYIYIFRHRCLVCGRVYCRQCVRTGMGEMTEGRKCIECLGRRFSQRYIQRAGEAGCFYSRYPSLVRQAELKWAEKGPRKSGERGYRTGMVSTRSRSPMSPRTPTGPNASTGPNSFVMSATYSPYTPTHQHFPF